MTNSFEHGFKAGVMWAVNLQAKGMPVEQLLGRARLFMEEIRSTADDQRAVTKVLDNMISYERPAPEVRR